MFLFLWLIALRRLEPSGPLATARLQAAALSTPMSRL